MTTQSDSIQPNAEESISLGSNYVIKCLKKVIERSWYLIDGMWKVHISSGILGVFAPMGQQEIVLKRDLHLASDEPWVKIG